VLIKLAAPIGAGGKEEDKNEDERHMFRTVVVSQIPIQTVDQFSIITFPCFLGFYQSTF